MGSRELDSIEFALLLGAIKKQGGVPLEDLDRDAGILNIAPRFWLVNGEPVIIESSSMINNHAISSLDGIEFKYLVHYPDDQEKQLFSPTTIRSDQINNLSFSEQSSEDIHE